MGLILVESPGINVALAGLKRFPLYGKHVPQNVTQSLALFRRRAFVEYNQSPLHLTLGEIAAQIARNPELGAGKVRCAVMTLVDLVGVVEFAEVFSFAALVVRRRVRVEIAHAEVWTAASLDSGGIDGPVRG